MPHILILNFFVFVTALSYFMVKGRNASAERLHLRFLAGGIILFAICSVFVDLLSVRLTQQSLLMSGAVATVLTLHLVTYFLVYALIHFLKAKRISSLVKVFCIGFVGVRFADEIRNAFNQMKGYCFPPHKAEGFEPTISVISTPVSVFWQELFAFFCQ